MTDTPKKDGGRGVRQHTREFMGLVVISAWLLVVFWSVMKLIEMAQHPAHP